ncbi:hypothetical protein GJV06_11685 [Enterobacteriaceae bacterium RIT691]|nr:hypothetical protein [Enterobacteriaceae bacterium RIT691]
MIIINDWKMDASQCTLTHQGTGETLRLGEFHSLLLEVFISYPDTVLSREFLIAEVWKNRVVGSNSLPTAIHALRLALGDDSKQKEIIKTIPKKGYFLNGEFISYYDNEPHSSSENTVSAPESAPENSHELTIPSGSNTLPSLLKRKFYSKFILIPAAFLLLIMSIAAWKMSDKPSVPDRVDVINDNTELNYLDMPDSPHVKIGYMFEQGTDIGGTAILNENAHPLALRLEQLMADNDASINVYVYPTMNKIVLDSTLTNGCHHTWQVIFRIDHWQRGSDTLDNYIYQHVERTLHEMPTCD